jgi:hypothetical protein
LTAGGGRWCSSDETAKGENAVPAVGAALPDGWDAARTIVVTEKAKGDMGAAEVWQHFSAQRWARIEVPSSEACFLQQQLPLPVRAQLMDAAADAHAPASEGIPARQSTMSRAASRRATSSSCYINSTSGFIHHVGD